MAGRVKVVIVDDDEFKRAGMAERLDSTSEIEIVDTIDQDTAAVRALAEWEAIDAVLVDVCDDRALGEIGTDVYSGISVVERVRRIRNLRCIAITPTCANPLVRLRLQHAHPDYSYHRFQLNSLDALLDAVRFPDREHGLAELPAEKVRRLGGPNFAVNTMVRAFVGSPLHGHLQADSSHKVLKHLGIVPPFFAHEGDVIARIAIGPGIIAHDGPRSLLPDVPGRDLYDATGTEVRRMIRLLVDEQARWIDRTHELLSLGVPDWRGPALTAATTDVVERTAPELEKHVLAQARRLVAGFEARFAAIAACGIPDSLVHGDFHQGNVRSGGADMVVLDWGDCGVGHPLLDEAAFIDRLAAADAHAARDAFAAAWQHAIPGSDPVTAARLLGPIAALRQAVIYRHFLDHIEPAEHGFHRDDPANWITRAVQ